MAYWPGNAAIEVASVGAAGAGEATHNVRDSVCPVPLEPLYFPCTGGWRCCDRSTQCEGKAMTIFHREMVEAGVVEGQWWHRLDDGRIQCDLCPRECKLHEGQRGFCFVRQAQDGGIVLTSYGRASGFCIDPIEKKPLNHFYPGTSVLSFGTAGCNLGCRFCQNWDISKARAIDRLGDWASPDDVAEPSARRGCHSIAFTYNDPVIFAQYAIYFAP